MLFETTVAILMAGLMTHVGDDSIAGDHKTHLIIEKDRSGAGHEPILGIFTLTMREEIHIQPGDKIWFENLPPGTAKAQPDFQTYTPSLAEPISHGFLSDAARKNERHKDIFASMVYPEGELSIFLYHNKEANFRRRNRLVRHQCVPRVTLFVSETSHDDFVWLHIEPSQQDHPIKLIGEVLLILVNQDRPDDHQHHSVGADEAKKHFANYAQVLQRRNLVTWSRLAAIEDGCPCGQEPKLPDDVTIAGVLEQLVLPAFVPKSLVSASGSSDLGDFLNILLSANPSCTNTDWP